MRKLILTAILLTVSALAFSQEAPALRTTSVPESSPALSVTVESAANSVGKWLGQLAQAPVAITKALASGVKSGYLGALDATPSATVEAPAEVPASTGTVTGIRERLESVLALAGIPQGSKQKLAPVEDRSVYVSSSREN